MLKTSRLRKKTHPSTTLRKAWDAHYAQAMESWLPKWHLVVEKKRKVGKLPLEIDIVVVRHPDNTAVDHPLWQHLFAHNLFEFKSSADPYHMQDWHSLLSYAGLYRQLRNLQDTDNIALWLFVERFPDSLRSFMQGRVVWEKVLPGVERCQYVHYPVFVVSLEDLPEEKGYDLLLIFASKRAQAVMERLANKQVEPEAEPELTNIASELYGSKWEEVLAMKKGSWHMTKKSAQIYATAMADHAPILEAIGKEKVLSHYTKEQLADYLRQLEAKEKGQG